MHFCQEDIKETIHVKFRQVIQEMSLKTFLIKSSGRPFVQWTETICAILKQSCEIILN